MFYRLTVIGGIIMSQSLTNLKNGEKPDPLEVLGTAASPQAQRVAPPQIQVDDSKAAANYTNFCRVTGTPEELVIDFGLNPQPVGVPTQPIAVTQRIVMNYFTAKRTLHALQLTVARHEDTFGVLETDVQRRVQMRPAQS
jgi:hypothetical protein